MSIKFSPIGISCYARPGHLERTLDALRANPTADSSDLFIFSDAAATGDEEAVEQVRQVAHAASGFASITVVERLANDRVFNNRDGMRQLLDRYGRMIWLEEDIVVAPGFLGFMNVALNTYRDSPKIFSVCGYRPPFELPDGYSQDAFALPRFSAWGFATWKDRWDRIRTRIPKAEYFRFLGSPREVYRFTRGGWDMLPMLHKDVYGQIDALDVKIFYEQFRLGMLTIYPTRFLAANAGHDGSGMHCVPTDRFDVDLDDTQRSGIDLPAEPRLDRRILDQNRRFREIGARAKFRFWRQALRDWLAFRRAERG